MIDEQNSHTVPCVRAVCCGRKSTWLWVLSAVVLTPVALLWLCVAFVIAGTASLVLEEPACNVARLSLYGELYATKAFGEVGFVSADELTSALEGAEVDENVVAYLLDVDSPGGTPVAGDTVARAFASSSLPGVAVIRDLGTSGAYWAALGTGYVIASPISDVGSIGVTMSYPEEAGVHEEEGGRFIELSSGAFKDAGNPDRQLSDEEAAYFQAQVDEVHRYFVDAVARMRPGLPRESIERLADGRAFTGRAARALGLIDELGSIEEGMQYLARVLEVPRDELVLCDAGNEGELAWMGEL